MDKDLFEEKSSINRQTLLKIKPILDPKVVWETDVDGNVVIELNRQPGIFGRLLGIFFAVPQKKKVVLDELGSFVWIQCDGSTTVREISAGLRERYKLDRREAQVSLSLFFNDLSKRQLIELSNNSQ